MFIIVNLYAALVFFGASQALMYAVNGMICDATQRYVDGTALATLCNLIAMIFVYRFWDSITEDEWDNVDDVFV